MRATRAILIYVAAIFLGGSLIAPWIHHGVQWMAGFLPVLEGVADEPFRRYLTRMWMVIAVLGLWPLLRQAGLKSWRETGWRRHPKAAREWGAGFALGFGSLAGVALIAIAFGGRELNLDHEAARWLRHLVNAALAALIVSTIEETVFRGGLFAALRREGSFLFAGLISSTVYGIVHFFERPPDPESVNWYTGLAMMPQMLRGFGNLAELIPGFISLTLAGLILAAAFERTGRIYVSIGLHAGWIFWLKSYGFLTREALGANPWIWGSRKLTDGWVCLVFMAVVWFAIRRILPPSGGPEAATAAADSQTPTA